MQDALYYFVLYWYYPVMVLICGTGIFLSRKKSWIIGVIFLTSLSIAAATEYREVRANQQFFIDELQRVLMDGAIAPGETEEYDIQDDIWAGEDASSEYEIDSTGIYDI
jgi:hypothetical protein